MSNPELASALLSDLDYEGLPLPEFSELHLKLRALPITSVDFDNLWGEEIESMPEQGSLGLSKIEKFVFDYAEMLISSVEMDEDLRRGVLTAVKQKEWSGIGADKSLRFVVRELMARLNRVKCGAVASWIEAKEGMTGLGEVAENELLAMIPALVATDNMFVKMRAENFPLDGDGRKAKGFTDEAAVVREVAGELREVKMHDAYPLETQVLLNSCDDAIANLEGLRIDMPDDREVDLIDRKLAYYRALKEAYKTNTLEAWVAADAAMILQVRDANDMICIHPIETGYFDQDRMLRAPELSFRPADLSEKAQAVREESAETLRLMTESFSTGAYADIPAVKNTLSLLTEGTLVALRNFTMGSGMEMELLPSGQMLPNLEAARVAAGKLDISLNTEMSEVRHKKAMKLARDIFGQQVFDEVFVPYFDFVHSLGCSTDGHERFHGVAITGGVEERLNKNVLMNPYAEEWKATFGGKIGALWLPYLRGEKTMDDLKSGIVGLIARSLRYVQMRSNPTVGAYFREATIALGVMEVVGVLDWDEAAEDEESWKIDLSDEKVKRFYEMADNQLRALLMIYNHGSEKDLEGWLQMNLHESGLMDYASAFIPVEGEECPEIYDTAAFSVLPSVKSRYPDFTDFVRQVALRSRSDLVKSILRDEGEVYLADEPQIEEDLLVIKRTLGPDFYEFTPAELLAASVVLEDLSVSRRTIDFIIATGSATVVRDFEID